MTLRRHLLAAALVALPALAAAPASAAHPDQIVVFGDSLVDAGNVFLATGGFAPTNTFDNPSRGYFPGRFTNGPDYTDLLSQRLYGHLSTAALAGGNNYAFGGATYVANSDPVPDLAAQVALYTAGSSTFGLSGHAVDPNALYIINLGGNDVFTLENPAFPAKLVAGYEAALLKVLATTVQGLDAAGASRILVTGIPNTDATGFALDALVQAKLDAIQPGLTNATLERFSYLNFFARLTADPAKFGVAPFTHLPSDGCFNHLTPPATADCSGYFSVDGVHPIAPIQAAIFREVAHTTGIGAVPEPAAWSLMIAGFGLVGTAVRRRAVAVAA
jgi:phospholipase/lecithinase/hemolysin